MDKLETKHIVLDTQFIVSQNFFQGELVKLLFHHSQKGRIKLYITDIVRREVVAKFKERLKEAQSILGSINSRKFKFMQMLSHYDTFFNLPTIDLERDAAEFDQKIDQLVFDNRMGILDSDDLKIKVVFDDYFNRRPPFEEAKKEEFPDAFNLYCIREYFRNKDKCYFITEDRGIKKYHSETVLTNVNVPSLLEGIARMTDPTPIEMVEQGFERMKDYVLENSIYVISDSIKSVIRDYYMVDAGTVNTVDVKTFTPKKIHGIHVFDAEDGKYTLICIVDFYTDVEIGLIGLDFFKERLSIDDPEEIDFRTKRVAGNYSCDLILSGSYGDDGSIIIAQYTASPVDILKE